MECGGLGGAAGCAHLRVVGLGELALAQEELEVPPGHEGQQHHGLLALLRAHVTDGQKVPGGAGDAEGEEEEKMLTRLRNTTSSMCTVQPSLPASNKQHSRKREERCHKGEGG